MTEAEWLACGDPAPMLRHHSLSLLGLLRRLVGVGDRWRYRKLRLFACAGCRRIWHLFPNDSPDEDSRNRVEVAERFADGLVTREELRTACAPYNFKLCFDVEGEPVPAAAAVLTTCYDSYLAAHSVEIFLNIAAQTVNPVAVSAERSRLAPLLRCIFGNPFRPVSFNPAWRTPDVLLLAQGIYDDRAFDRMPILADALQDAGCDNDDILNHCHDTSTPHARGCWVVDLVLGKV